MRVLLPGSLVGYLTACAVWLGNLIRLIVLCVAALLALLLVLVAVTTGLGC